MTAVLICTPTRGMISVETHIALTQNLDGFRCAFLCIARKPVDQARNELAKMALAVASKPPCTDGEALALWVDDDAWWPRGTVARMVSMMRSRPEVDILTGYTTARLPYAVGTIRPYGSDHPVALSELDADKDGLCRVESGVGFHFLLHRLAVLEKVGANPFTVPQGFCGAEDHAFCARASDAGLSIYLDFHAPVAHIDVETGLAFLPRCAPGRIHGNAFVLAPGFDGVKDLSPSEILKRFPKGGRKYGAAVDAGIHRSEARDARAGITVESVRGGIAARLREAGRIAG